MGFIFLSISILGLIIGLSKFFLDSRKLSQEDEEEYSEEEVVKIRNSFFTSIILVILSFLIIVVAYVFGAWFL